MSSLDDKIDDLYRQPLADFTGARNALAKSLEGADAKRVRALAKPTLVPWAVNQVYWRARAIYERLLKCGQLVRKAQIAVLEGRAADVLEATEAHRQALSDAVREAARFAASAGSDPSSDALMRTFEAMSLAAAPPEPPGRLTQPIQPMGFEVLTDVRVRDQPKPTPTQTPREDRSQRDDPRPGGDRKHDRAAAEAARRHEAALKQAQMAIARAEAAERRAREVWERAHDALLDARRAVANLKSVT